MSSFDPGEIMVEVEDGAHRLEKASDEMYAATLRAEKAEHAYERAVETELVKIYHEAKQSGDRVPAEDLRRALAHQRIDQEVYAEHLAAKAEQSAKDKLYRARAAALSARQSLLKALGSI